MTGSSWIWRPLPWIEFVTVKESHSASEATLRPLQEARADLRTGAERAVSSLERARVMTLTLPITAALRAIHPARLDVLEGVPGIDYENHTVTFQAADFGEAYDGLIALTGVASFGYQDVLNEATANMPGGPELLLAQTNALYRRFLDVESGRWTPPPEPAAEASPRYHGVR